MMLMLWEPGWLLRCRLMCALLLVPVLVKAASPYNLTVSANTAAGSSALATTTASPASVEVYSRFMQLGRQHPFLSQATALVQDAQGFLWVGTQHGLYRYDGQVVESYRADPTDTNSLSSDWISTLMLDRRGQLWVGTRYGGLNVFDPATERFSRIAIPRSQGIVQQVEISALYQDQNLQIWVGTFGAGLYRWQADNQQLELVQLPASAREIDGLFINSLLLDNEGYLWIGTGSAPLRNRGQHKGGALRWHPQRLDKQQFSVDNSALPVAAVTAIKMDGAGQIWLTSYGGGLLRYLQSSQKLQVVAQQPALLKNGLLTDIWFGNDGEIWISSYDHGLWFLPGPDQAWQRFRANPIVAHQIQSNNLTGLWLDNQQTLWIKSPAGIYALSAMAQQVRNIPVDPNNPSLLAHNDVFGISLKSAQTYWLANRDAGVAEADLTTATVKRWPIKLAKPQSKMPTLVRQVLQDYRAMVWIGTDSGLFQLDQTTGLWHSFALTKAEVQPHIGVLYQDSSNRLWVGTRGEGLFLLDGASQTQFRQDLASDVGLASDTISTLGSDDLNDLWIGYTDQGISRLDLQTGKIESWRQGTNSASGLRFNGIQLIYPEGGELWVRAGNVNHRVLRSKDDPKKIEGFKAYAGGEDADIYLRKAPNFLWLYRSQLQNQDLVQFNEADGFQVTTWIGSWLVSKDGLQLRGGNQGLDYYVPAKFEPNPEPLVVRLTGFNLFNKKVRPAQDQKSVLQRAIGYASDVRLNYEQDMFTLQFSALDFVQPGQTRYRYRLTGFDRDWIETDASSRQATYTRLAPGDYQFEVMARRPGQGWPTDGATRVLIKIMPPWWLTWWAKLAAVLLSFSAIWAFLHFRLRNERQTRNWLEQVVSRRTAELQTQNQALAESYRDMTLLQMLAKQITASLDLQEILFLCHRSLNEIMDVHVLAIGIYRPESQSLEFSHWLENGRLMDRFELKLQPEVNLAAVSFNQQREINIQQREQFLNYLPEIPPPINGAPMQSVLYFPLVVNGEHIGCLSLQSPRVEAFAPQQINLVRTLTSNIAIAVANAQIVARLQQTQQQLVMQEKMASLGGLVAGVAHEVNTPLGICVTAASHLQLELAAITLAHQQRQLQIPEFERFLETANTAALMLTQNTDRAAALISSFKQVAVDKSAISLREFDVAEYLKEVVRSLQPELNRRQCQLQLLSEPGITLYADAGSLAQLITHLVMNSLQHGFSAEMPVPALIELKIQKTPAHIQLEYRDNGCGMSAETLKRLFDPFFTTKRSEGNSGLGAHIVYNLVTAQLNGSIYASSEPGQGLYYRILLPLLRRPD
jgi:ligand-binding sensor domain-containing protein/signal transduction histidine kinase